MIVWLCSTALAQNFLAPVEVSWGMEAYAVTLTGERFEGSVRLVADDAGWLRKLVLKAPDGTKHKIMGDDIVEMGVVGEGVARPNVDNMAELVAGGRADFVVPDWVVWRRLSDGQVESLVQQLNPGFDHLLQVYPDPTGRGTGSIGLMGMVVAGGGAASYWVVRDGESTPIQVHRKTYEDEWLSLFADCPAVMRPTPAKLSDFAQHVYDYDKRCAPSAAPPPGPVDRLPPTTTPAPRSNDGG